ncbi:MAG: iron-sulfur cluster assembly scaffold protein [Pyrinomonadaceae bacterium]
MSFYPAKIQEQFINPRSVGIVEFANAIGTGASFICGAVLKISLKIEKGKIADAKFKAAGCGYLIAAADVLCEKVIGKSINQGVNIFELIENELGKFENPRHHCVELVWQTWQTAINYYRAAEAAEENGEDALVCSCFGISERVIESAIVENLLATVADVTRVCRAGGGCGSCQPLIEDILGDVWRG